MLHGHMKVAIDDIKKILKKVHLILEIVDARAPLSTESNLLQVLTKHKIHIKILSKSDLADLNETNRWLDFFRNANKEALIFNYNDPYFRKKLLRLCYRKTGRGASYINTMRIMIIGIPNIGKSTIINRLVNKKKAKVENSPGITKAVTQYILNENCILYDTPGIINHKKYDISFYNLILCNNYKLIDNDMLEEIAKHLLTQLEERYVEILKEFYGINAVKDITVISKRYNIVKKGGVFDIIKTMYYVIKDFKNNRIKNITLEIVPD